MRSTVPLIPQAEPPAPSARPNAFGALLRALVEPSPDVIGLDRRRQARTLAITILAVAILAVVLEAITIVASTYIVLEVPYDGYKTTFYTILPLVAAYWLSRTRHITLGAIITTLSLCLAVFVRAVIGEPRFADGYLNYLVLPLIVGSLFLDFKNIIWISVLNFIGILLVPFLIPVSFEQIVTGSFSFLLLIGAMVGIVARYRDLLERDRQVMLRESEAKYRTVVEQIPAITYIEAVDSTSPTGSKPIYLSPQFEKYLGYPVKDYQANPLMWFNIVHPEDLERVRSETLAHYQTGQPLLQEYRLFDKDKRVLWFRDQVVIRWEESSKRHLSQGILLDITDSKLAEARIRREAARAEALLRVAGRLSAQLSLDTLLSTVCDEARRALNVSIASLSLYDDKHDVFIVTAASGISIGPDATTRAIPRSAYELGMKQFGGIIAIPDISSYEVLPNRELYMQMGVRSLAAAMMVYESELIGSLNALSVGEIRDFTEDEKLLLQGIADQAALAIVNTRLFKEARRRLEHLQALRAIDIAITSNLDLAATLNTLLESITTQLNVDAAVVLLLDESSQTLQYGASRGFNSEALKYTRLRLGEGNGGRAALERRIVSVVNLSPESSVFFQSPLLAGEKFVAYFAAPLISKNLVRGVIEIFHRHPLDPDAEWMSFLDALAGQAAIAIDNSTLVDALQRTNLELADAYDATIEGWSHALDLRDKETEGHTLRVTELSLRLARALGLLEDQLIHIRRGGLLHDIGKMGVPDSILLKPGPLDEAEWEVMRRHPAYAYEMLLPIAYLRPALDIPYCHHEKWDGTGYPRGLKGEQIPLAARVFAIADVWDALCSDRPYRQGWPIAKVRDHIASLAGTHFEPRLVELFLRIINRGE
jgi:PAS domain S-box-containing protein/putative nucleotidyltransferase with HDIG domain